MTELDLCDYFNSYYKCLELRPHGELLIKGRLPNIRRRIPHGVQTLVSVAAADDPGRRVEEQRQGDGEAEGRALDNMDKLHWERIVFKGTGSCDHLTALIDRREH